MSNKVKITIARGDGIGPEIMDATLRILDAARAQLQYDEIEVGKKVYEQGFNTGLKPEAWDSLDATRVLLKAPITTPQGGGYKSLNVTIRKKLGLFANVRPCVAYAPFIATKHPNMDMVIIRENEEDLYAGIEYQQTASTTQCLKLISVAGSERIVRHAFEYARMNDRRKITCMTKDNIMKISDGLFHRIFNKIGEEYPDIEQDHYIVDIGTARVADNPGLFDVIVTLNLYGDIISDVAAEVAGSVGLAGSANIGENCAMFEAIHGSAPDIAGKDRANPSGLLLAAVMMLVHIGNPKAATQIHNAWLATIESGVHTADIFSPQTSRTLVGTQEFTEAVIQHLGQTPRRLHTVKYEAQPQIKCHNITNSSGMAKTKRKLVGVDVFIQHSPDDLNGLVKKLQCLDKTVFDLETIANRGTKVWPNSSSTETLQSELWCCRFKGKQTTDNADIPKLLQQLDAKGLDFVKTEQLYNFDGKRGYTLAQGA